jgi:hypothetical protein
VDVIVGHESTATTYYTKAKEKRTTTGAMDFVRNGRTASRWITGEEERG